MAITIRRAESELRNVPGEQAEVFDVGRGVPRRLVLVGVEIRAELRGAAVVADVASGESEGEVQPGCHDQQSDHDSENAV